MKELKDLNLELEQLLNIGVEKVNQQNKSKIKLEVFTPQNIKTTKLEQVACSEKENIKHKESVTISENAVLELKELNKTFKTTTGLNHTIKNMSFKIYENSFTTLYGPSGSGKTTILNLITGILQPTSGNIYIHNQDITKLKTSAIEKLRYENIGFIFQNYNLIEDLNVFENISIVAKKFNKNEVLNLIEKLGLNDVIYQLPNSLSGGQKQRVAIARSLVNKPKLLICDEPTAALDIENKKLILKLLQEVKETFNASVLIVTHDENIKLICDQILTIKDGELINVQNQDEVFDIDAINWV